MRANGTLRSWVEGGFERLCAAICAVVMACALIACIAAAAAPHGLRVAYADAPMQAASVSAIPYDGDTVAFYTADLSKKFGMLSNPSDDVRITLADGMVSMSWVPSNNNVYKGFYLNASIDDVSTWNAASFVAPVGDHYELTLPESYCGQAWPVAPEKYADRGGGTTADQYYLTIPPADKIKPPIQYVTVTFTDGQGNTLKSEQVAQGGDATAPSDPALDGFTFAGWDRPYTGVVQDTEVNALWASLSGNSHRVTFVNGYGATIVIRMVEDGKGATAPSDPARDGYAFIGWEPADFSSVKGDLTVTAQWISNDLLEAYKATQAIETLPADPKTLLRDTGNGQVTAAAAAYNALSAAQKAHVPEASRMRLAKCAIAVLPSDPYKVTAAHSSAIAAAQTVYDSLPASLQSALDDESVSSSRSYGRYLQSAAWALDSLRLVNNVSLLPSGTYTGQVTSASSMGKSNSQRSIAFTVKSVMVSGGRVMAILEHGSNSSQTLRMGGIEYQNLQTDPTQRSYYEVPIVLNSTFHFSVKGKNATDDTDAIVYEMTVTADEASMKPDVEGGKGSASGGESTAGSRAGGSASGGSGSGVNLNTLVSGSTANAKGPSTASTASAGLGQAGTGGKTSATVTQLDLASAGGVTAFVVSEDLVPAAVGAMMLFVSIGVLGFTLRFLRRENVHR